MNNPHQDARTTVYSRGLMVQRVLEGKEVAEVARDFGVRRRTVHKWLSRYREGGEEALDNGSSRPHRSPRRVRADKLHKIERLRSQRKSSLQIASCLSMPLSTVTLILRRLGLNRLSRLQPKPPA